MTHQFHRGETPTGIYVQKQVLEDMGFGHQCWLMNNI